MKRSFFPSGLVVNDRDCLVIGDDEEAQEKSVRLAEAGAKVTLIGKNLPKEIVPKLNSVGILILNKDFELADLLDPFFVILCIKDNPKLTEAVFEICRKRRILLCAIDQTEFCDVVNVSFYERGHLKIMIATEGVAPALAKKIRLGLEQSLKDTPLENFLEDLAAFRKKVTKEIPNLKERRTKLIEAVKDVEFKVHMKLPKGGK